MTENQRCPICYIDVESIKDVVFKNKVKKYQSYYQLMTDLSFAKSCILAWNQTTESLIKTSLWRSAIISYFRVFDMSSKGRSNVIQNQQINKILSPDLLNKHQDLIMFRKKLIAHQDITDLYQQKFGILLNPSYQDKKILSLVSFEITMVGETTEEHSKYIQIFDAISKFIGDISNVLGKEIEDEFKKNDIDFLYKYADK
jgi:hypothetical protein